MQWGEKKLGFKEVKDVLVHKGKKSLKQKTWLAKEEMKGAEGTFCLIKDYQPDLSCIWSTFDVYVSKGNGANPN